LVAFVAGGIFAGTRLSAVGHYSLPGPTETHFLAGAFIVVAGTTLRLWAILTLGRFFRSTVMIQPNHEVIASGPYRLVRHPSYTGVLLSCFGIGIALGSWLSLLVMMPLVFIGLYVRIRVEEDVLSSSLGDSYRQYMRSTRRLIPFLY